MKTRAHFVVPSKRRAFRLLGLAVCLFSLALLSLPGLLAQTVLSTVLGTVADQTGAVVPGAEITLRDVGTNLTRSTISDDLGNFQFTDIQYGTYRLTTEMPGFKTSISDNVLVESSQVRRVDILLEIGEATTEVTVEAGAAVIETEESKISAGFDVENYQSTPQLGMDRFNANMILATLPGVQMDEFGFGMNVAGLDGSRNFQEGMDGAPTDGTVNNVNQMEDTVEVKIITANNTAEYSRAAYFNLVTKRGNNDFHGNAYWYNINSALAARQYFAPEKATQNVHIMGASASGKIIEDRTFFFASYNGQRDPSGHFFQASVPTALMRQGDFTDSGTVIHDPLTGQPFPGNMIPPERISSVSSAVQSNYLPAPNLGEPGLLTRNFGFEHDYPLDLFQIDYTNVRIDHALSENNELSGRFLQNWIPYVLPRGFPAMTWTRVRYNFHWVMSDTHIFSPTLVATARFGWHLREIEDGTTVDGFTPVMGADVVSQLGLQGVNPQGLNAMGFPRMNVSGLYSLSVRPGGLVTDEDEVSWAGSVAWTKGAHQFRFGSQVRPWDRFRGSIPEGTFGVFDFDGSFTNNAHADFLLGLPRKSFRLDPLVNRTQLSYEFGAYFTDTFKVSPKLTLDFGLRWDYFGASTYEDGKMYNWDSATGDVIVPSDQLGAVSPLYPDNITIVAGDVVAIPQKNNFAPRFGAAYRFGDNVIRGGYGIFNEYMTHFNNAQGGGPFALGETFFNEIVGGQPLFAFPNPFPGGFGAVGSQSVSGYPRGVENGLIHQFNLTVERELPGAVGVRVSYVGTRARGLNYDVNLNKPQPSLIPFSQDRRPYPEFISTNFAQRDGDLNYNGFTFRVLRKVGAVTFDTHWTWAHNLANNLNRENPYNLGLWNRVRFVARHRVVLNLQWKLPTLPDAPGAMRAIAAGWQANVVSFFQTGQYFSPSYSGADPSNTSTFGGLPDRISDGNLPSAQRDVDRWFDTACCPTTGAFTVPQPGTFGNSGVNILEGPGRNVTNLAIGKDFYLTEQVKLHFSTGITNLFNHPNFRFPSNNISTATGGVVSGDVGIFNMEKATARRMEMRLRIKW